MNGEGATDGSADADPLAEMRAAVGEIRREGRKAALVYALVDGALVAVLANLVVGVAGIEALDRAVPLPRTTETVAVGVPVAAVAGLATVLVEYLLRTRRPLVERFEAANPSVHEALRTARDASAAGQDTRMARALYAEVIDRLAGTSSLGLVDARRLGIAILLLVAASVGTVGTAASGFEVEVPGEPGGGGPDAEGPGNGAGPAPPGTPGGGLRPGGDILGTPEDVSAGSENISAMVPSERGGGEGDRDRSYREGGLPSDGGALQAQRAGYAPPEELENAELIKEYNLRIREEDG